MLPKLDVPKKDSPFESADDLVRYMEFRLQTERALVSMRRLAELGFIANYNICITRKEYEGTENFVSLHKYAEVVSTARRRVNKGLVPDDWFQRLTALMNKR